MLEIPQSCSDVVMPPLCTYVQEYQPSVILETTRPGDKGQAPEEVRPEEVRHRCMNHYKFSALMSSWSRDIVQPNTLRTCSDSCISVGPPLTAELELLQWASHLSVLWFVVLIRPLSHSLHKYYVFVTSTCQSLEWNVCGSWILLFMYSLSKL